MPLFDLPDLDSLIDTFDPEFDDSALDEFGRPRRARKRPGAPAPVVREVVAEVSRANQNPFSRVAGNFARDVSEFGRSMGQLAGQVVFHPLQTASAVGEAITERPLETAEQLLIDPFKRYVPPEGESFMGNLAKQVEEHPFAAMMDAATVLGGAGLIARGASAGGRVASLARAAEGLEAGAAALDPLQLAIRGAKAAAPHLPKWTGVPGLAERRHFRQALEDITFQRNEKSRLADQQFEEGLQTGPYGQLTPDEASVVHPYAEGLVVLRGADGKPLGSLEEMTVQRIEAAASQHRGIVAGWEDQLGYTPEVVAQEAAQKAVRGLDPTADITEVQRVSEEAYQSALEEAISAQRTRQTVSLRTALDNERLKKFREQAEQTKLEAAIPGLAEEAHRIKPADYGASTPEEAFAEAAQRGATPMYFPHTQEILTDEQVTFGNFLTKVREAIPYRHNKEVLARMGLTQTPDELQRALERGELPNLVRESPFFADRPLETLRDTARKIERKGSLPELLDQVGRELGKPLAKGEKLVGNADFIGDPKRGIPAKYQLLVPHLRIQDQGLADHMQQILDFMGKHADDPAVQGADLADIARRVVGGADSLIPVKGIQAYKVPTALGDEIKRAYDQANHITPNFLKAFDHGSDIWRWTTLNLRPAWVLNNVGGNTMFAAMHGIHPLNPTGLMSLIDAGRAMAKHELGIGGKQAEKLAGVFALPGVTSGLYAAEARTGVSAWMKQHTPRLIAAGGELLPKLNEKVENLFRASAAFYALRKGAKGRMQESASAVTAGASIGDKIGALRAQGVGVLDDATMKDMTAFTDKVFNNYRKQSVMERTWLRRLAPFHKFYRHAIETAIHFPFDQPVKARIWRSAAEAVQQDVKEQVEAWGFDYDKDVRGYLKDYIPWDIKEMPDGTQSVRMVSARGVNPLNVLSSASSDGEALGNMHPLLKVAIEWATGVDLFKMREVRSATDTYTGKHVDPATQEVVEGTTRVPFIENLGRQFWPYKTIEQLMAHGRQPFDTTTLLDQIRQSPEAYRRDPRTNLEIRRPQPNWPTEVLARPLYPPPQYLQPKSKAEERQEQRTASEQLNKIWRYHPELRAEIEAKLRAGRAKARVSRFSGVKKRER